MASVDLTRDQYRRLVDLIARRAGILTPLQRENLLEMAGLGQFATRLNFDTEARTFAGQLVRVSTTRVYDDLTQIVHLTGYHRWHDGKEEQTPITRTALRYTCPQELAALLQYEGFIIIRQYGDWNLEPPSATSPSNISVCRKRL